MVHIFAWIYVQIGYRKCLALMWSIVMVQIEPLLQKKWFKKWKEVTNSWSTLRRVCVYTNYWNVNNDYLLINPKFESLFENLITTIMCVSRNHNEKKIIFLVTSVIIFYQNSLFYWFVRWIFSWKRSAHKICFRHCCVDAHLLSIQCRCGILVHW